MNFQPQPQYEGEHYLTTKEFNGCTYYLYFTVECGRVWVNLSSGNKRKHKLTFEDKQTKSKGGLPALIWAKNIIGEFPKWYSENRKWKPNLKMICVAASDSRRKRIYKRSLAPLGFTEVRIEGTLVLAKKI